jgi:hypothetical protein
MRQQLARPQMRYLLSFASARDETLNPEPETLNLLSFASAHDV